ncbi:MAG: hypothetical protein F7C38_03310 [Desulfurococcales archaeon]|nr:hypothetical protein [Desulfurococcales archaeon]
MNNSRDGCTSSSVAGCVLIASAGGIALLSLVVESAVVPIIYTIIVLSLGLVLYNISGHKLSTTLSVSTIIIILLSIYYSSIIVLTAVFYATLLLILYSTKKIELSLAYWPVVILPAYAYGGVSWLPLYSALSIATSVMLSYMESKRGHVFMMLTIAPIVVMVDPLLSAAISASTLALSVVLAGIVERSGCPFTQDSGLVFVGVGVSLLGVLAALAGKPWANYWLVLWITGFLFIEAGALVPQELYHSSAS